MQSDGRATKPPATTMAGDSKVLGRLKETKTYLGCHSAPVFLPVLKWCWPIFEIGDLISASSVEAKKSASLFWFHRGSQENKRSRFGLAGRGHGRTKRPTQTKGGVGARIKRDTCWKCRGGRLPLVPGCGQDWADFACPNFAGYWWPFRRHPSS
jgi:hypothetical protein